MRAAEFTDSSRTLYSQFTFKADKDFLSSVLNMFIETVDPIKHIPGIFSGFVLQPITQIARANRHKKGGSPFGIKEEDGSLVSQYTLISKINFRPPLSSLSNISASNSPQHLPTVEQCRRRRCRARRFHRLYRPCHYPSERKGDFPPLGVPELCEHQPGRLCGLR